MLSFLQLIYPILTKLGLAISWLISKPRLLFEIVLVAALLVAGFLYRKQEVALAEAQVQYGKLAANLQQQITIKNNEIQVLKRIKGKVELQTVYVPGEGHIIIQQSTPTVHYVYGSSYTVPGDITVIVKTKGWCFRPGMGLGYGPKGFQGLLDAKFGYYSRYSSLATVTKSSIGVSISRHIDDIMFFKPENVEVFATYNLIKQQEASSFLVGIRSNF